MVFPLSVELLQSNLPQGFTKEFDQDIMLGGKAESLVERRKASVMTEVHVMVLLKNSAYKNNSHYHHQAVLARASGPWQNGSANKTIILHSL